MSDDIVRLTATEGIAAVRRRELRPSQWAEACLARAQAVDPLVNAWQALDVVAARRAAAALDARDWAGWRPEPALAGLPLAVKDIFNTMDLPTCMGSDLWEGFTPGNDARVVAQAKLLGAFVLGKTVTAEFAVHTPGSTRNPHSSEHIAGTSSTGSAVAVVTGMAPAGLGTQSAGSIIRPASYVGAIGFKPSFGLIPRTGVLKTADTLDSIGWFARSVADIRLLLQALRVRGRDYPVVEGGLARQALKRRPGAPWRLALATPPTSDDWNAGARRQLTEYAYQLGNRPDVRVIDLDLRQGFADAHAVHRRIYHKQLAYYFQRELQRGEAVNPIFRQITDEGRGTSTAEYVAALRRQNELEHALEAALSEVDALITLSVAGEAPRWTDGPERDDSCLIWTLAGAPAITLPLFRGPNGLPFGAQLVAPRYGDVALLELAELLFPGIVPIVEPVRAGVDLAATAGP